MKNKKRDLCQRYKQVVDSGTCSGSEKMVLGNYQSLEVGTSGKK